MHRSLYKKTLLFIAVILLVMPSFAQDLLSEASILEKNGESRDAVKLYSQWLKENRSDLRYADILLHGSSLISDVENSVQFLLDHTSALSRDDSLRIYRQIAELYVLSFRLSEAADYYRMAARMKEDSPDPELMLQYYKLKYQNGEIPEEGKINVILLNRNISPQTYVDALLFKAELLKASEEYSEAIELLMRSPFSTSYPEIQFALWELFGFDDKPSEQQKIVAFMKTTFPDSVELALMLGTVKKVTRLSDLFLGVEQEVIQETIQEPTQDQTYVQTGVFRSRSNAEALRDELRHAGFKAEIFSERGTNRVIVSSNESADVLISRLRRGGFSAFTIDFPGDPD